MKAKKHPVLLFMLSLLCLFIVAPSLSAQNDKVITFREGDNIRNIAEEHLNDANRWNEILKINGLSSITDLKPGMKIKIPASDIILADKALENSLKKIQEATKAGARLLAPVKISEAIDIRDEAIALKNNSEWKNCIIRAEKASSVAQEALTIAKNKNNVPAEAVLDDKTGDVESKTDSDLLWDEIALNSTLVEREKVRTLSLSYAEIVFKDESRLRLNENSQAVIQKMRSDVIQNKQESSVSLVQGDMYALLSGNPRKKMDIKVPGVDTDIKSKNFWINKDKGGVKVANYDGTINLSSGGRTVELGKNKGVMVKRNQRPTDPKDLLPGPKLVFPEHNSTAFRTDDKKEVEFKWEAVENAVGYWLEVAYEKSTFHILVINRFNIRENIYSTREIKEDGVYYWRVAAIDKQGFPGIKSESRLVKVITDNVLPFVYMNIPDRGVQTTKESFVIEGETEHDAILNINDKKVDVDSLGNFAFPVSLNEGENSVKVKLIDIAGNVNEFEKNITYLPLKEVTYTSNQLDSENDDGEGRIISRGAGFNFSGITDPDARISLASTKNVFASNTFSDKEDGSFGLSAPLSEGENEFDIVITAPGGYQSKSKIKVQSDVIPPDLILTSTLPAYTNEVLLNISGKSSDASGIRINEYEITPEEGKFSYDLELKDGANNITISAIDDAGNQRKIKRIVILDQKAPEIKSYKFSRKQVNPGDVIGLEIICQDNSPLKKAIPFSYECGGVVYNSFLHFNEDMNLYTVVINIEPVIKGAIKLLSVTTEDILGNKTQITY